MRRDLFNRPSEVSTAATPLDHVPASSRRETQANTRVPSRRYPAPEGGPQVIRPQGRGQPTSPTKLPSESRVGRAVLEVSSDGPALGAQQQSRYKAVSALPPTLAMVLLSAGP